MHILTFDDDEVEHATDQRVINLCDTAFVFQTQVMDNRAILAVPKCKLDVVGRVFLAFGTRPHVANSSSTRSRCCLVSDGGAKNPSKVLKVG